MVSSMGMSASQFLAGNIAVAVVALATLAAQQLLGMRLSGKARTRLWIPFLISLIACLFPQCASGALGWVAGLLPQSEGLGASGNAAVTTSAAALATAQGAFYADVQRFDASQLANALAWVWVAGFAVQLARGVAARVALARRARRARPFHFDASHFGAAAPHGLERFSILVSHEVDSPLTFGVLKPRILIPEEVGTLPPTKILNIVRHEAEHIRHADSATVFCLFVASAAFWLNPIARLALAHMRFDLELWCDERATAKMSEDGRREYGLTLIDLAARPHAKSAGAASAGFSSRSRQLECRIKRVADAGASRHTTATRLAAAALALVAAATLPIAAALGDNGSTYRPTEYEPIVASDALREVLSSAAAGETSAGEGTERGASSSADAAAGASASASSSAGADKAASTTAGSTASPAASASMGANSAIVLLDGESNLLVVSDETAALTRVPPDSTYKVLSGANALEWGTLPSAKTQLLWDGTARPFTEWNQNLSLDQAMSVSANWFFQKLDAKAGAGNVASQLERVGYGNASASASLSDFWLESSLKISPVEQAIFLKKLIGGKLDFAPETVAAINDALYLGSIGDARVFGKTGTGSVNGELVRGWFIGWVERGNQMTFCAVHLEGAFDGSCAQDAALEALRAYGLIGKGGFPSLED